MTIINKASDKFKDRQDEVCGFVFGFMREMNTLEDEIFERSEELKRHKLVMGIPKHQVGPGEEELWDEYKERMKGIITPKCTEKLLKRPCGMSFGKPAKYGYIDGDCRVDFIMKSAKKAIIVTHYKHGTEHMLKTELSDDGSGWLVNAVYYGFASDPDKWYIDSIH